METYFFGCNPGGEKIGQKILDPKYYDKSRVLNMLINIFDLKHHDMLKFYNFI
jgi:hypothetical protein